MRSLALLLPMSVIFLATACGDEEKSTGGPDDAPEYTPEPGNAAPEVSFTSHRDGDTERDGYGFELAAQVTDADHDVADLEVSILADGVDVCSDLAISEDGLVSCSVMPTEGTLELTLIAVDPDGERAEAAVSITVNPTDAPEARIDLPTAENVRYYTDIAIDIAAAIGDTETAVEDLEVTLTSDLDPDVDFGIEIDADGNLTGSSILSEGEHTLTLTVVDETGKMGQDSVVFEVGPDNNAPLCSIAGPTDGAATLSGDTTALDAEVSDPDVDNDFVFAQWTSDIDGVLSEGIASADGVADLDVTLSDGAHVLTFSAVDETGATCAATITHVVGTAPLASIDSPFDGETIDEGTEITFSASVGDAETAASDLTVAWTDAAGTTLYEGAPDSAGLATFTTDELEAGAHEITLTVTDADGFSTSASIAFTINAAPSAPVVSLAPSTATTSDDLVAAIDVDAVDPEGDAISYTYTWYVDGVASAASTSDTLPASATAKGESWSVAVVANDGRIDGDAGVASMVIANQAPVASAVALSPDPAATTADLTCAAEGADADGDPISWSYAWSIDGAPASETSDTLANSAFSKGQSIVCEATPSDGTDSGAALASAAVVITNTAPVIDSAILSPDPVDSSGSAACVVSASDDDGDSLTFTYAWTVDGADPGVTSEILDPAYFARGSEIACTAIASDGSEDSAAVTTATMTITNSAPSMDTVDITPGSADVTTDLTCTAAGSDADGDALSYSYSWTVNGVDAGSTDTLAAGSFAKGDLVACQAFANDGYEDGDALESDELIIANSAPSVDAVSVVPGTARVSDTLTCTASVSDADGDSLTTTYAWSIDGADAGVSSDTLSTGSFEKGESIVCTVETHDGDTASDPVSSAALVISNTKPAVSSVSLSPAAPTTDDTITCTAAGTDADSDPVSFTYEWTVDGVAAGTDAMTLASSEFTKGQTVACKVTPNDGTDDGSWAITGGKTIGNTAPEITSIAISPADPSDGDDLTCGVSATDADGDSVTYTYAWTRNGANAGVSTQTLSSFTTSRGDVYTCTATPSDGSDAGLDATSSSVTVVNEAPVISLVTLSSASPGTDDTITASAVVSDGDGDSTSVTYEWYVGGVMVQSGASATLSGSVYFDKGDSVYAVATANDGYDDSAAVQSNTASVANTPPEAPEVVIDPEAPEVSDDLICMIDVVSNDADGDPVGYMISWELNGTSWTGATSDTTWPGDTIPAGETADNDEWTCIATPNDGTDSGPTASADETVLPSQVVYELVRADLLNQADCGSPGEPSQISDGSADWGFTWEDTSGRTPSAITLDFNIGNSCASGTFDVSLNGVVIDTITPAGNCACAISGGTEQPYSLVPVDLSAYDPEGTNEVTVDAALWGGLYPDGADNFAVVTIDY